MASFTRNHLLEGGLDHAARGRPVFPCDRGKRPLVAGGFKAATTDADTIREWWRRWPEAMIGVPTGAASGIVAIDLDIKGGADGLAALKSLRAGRPLPPTTAAGTGSGGRHIYFAAVPGRTVRCSAGRLAAGVDVRGDGGYIITSPSPGYTLEREVEPLPPPPPWLLDLLDPPPAPRPGPPPAPAAARLDMRLAALVRTAAAAPEGIRNRILFWCCCRLGEMVREGALGEAAAMAMAEVAGVAAGLPPSEVARTAASGLRAGMGGATHA